MTTGTRETSVRREIVAEAPGRTRVALEHRHLDRYGEGWEGLPEGVAADQGWPLYLERYTEVVTA